MDRLHSLSIVVIATTMASLPVLMHRAVLISLDLFPFQWIVEVIVSVQVVYDFVVIKGLARKAKFNAEAFNFVFRQVVFIVFFKPECSLVIKFGVLVILKVNRTNINTDIACHDSVLPCLRVFSEAKRG